MKLLKKYRMFLFTLVLLGILFFVDQGKGIKAIKLVGFSFKEMILVIPPIFVLLGLLDVWVKKDVMVKYMGDGSGIKGIILAFVIGSASAGPLYGAFPVAAVFMKKGVKFSNILIFIGAWSTTKVPMFLFELNALGIEFALTRLLINIPGIIIIAFILSKMISKKELTKIYQKAESL